MSSQQLAGVTSVVAHDGGIVEYEVHGAGPTVMVPFLSRRVPMPGFDELGAAMVEALSDRFRVVLLELLSTPKPDTLTPENVVADVLAVADAVEADSFAWVGYSWTAAVGLQVATTSDRVSALIMGGFPPLGGPYRELLEMVLTSVEAASAAGLDPGQQRQFATFYGHLQEFDDVSAQQHLRMPRLCLVGAEDRLPLSDGGVLDLAGRVMTREDELVELGWHVVDLPGLDHVAAASPQVLPSLVAKFLSEVGHD